MIILYTGKGLYGFTKVIDNDGEVSILIDTEREILFFFIFSVFSLISANN